MNNLTYFNYLYTCTNTITYNFTYSNKNNYNFSIMVIDTKLKFSGFAKLLISFLMIYHLYL